MEMKNGRKTLALVDGASLHKCCAERGVHAVSAHALLKFLRRKIPNSGELLPPVITMLPNLAVNPIGRAFEQKGFEVVPSWTDGEADDFLLCSRIQAADPKKIGQIVMVGQDHCYIRPLWEKYNQNVSICWFVADTVSNEGKPRIGRTLRRFLTCGLFTWVDMKPFIPELRHGDVQAINHK